MALRAGSVTQWKGGPSPRRRRFADRVESVFEFVFVFENAMGSPAFPRGIVEQCAANVC
jgi:hypothetical protein